MANSRLNSNELSLHYVEHVSVPDGYIFRMRLLHCCAFSGSTREGAPQPVEGRRGLRQGLDEAHRDPGKGLPPRP